MFLSLLLATLFTASVVSAIAAFSFNKPVKQILARLIADPISEAWRRYLHFALFVVGISTGVRIHDLERYISPPPWAKDAQILELTSERWVLEIYRTIIGSLQGIAWMMLFFFIVALVAYVIVRIASMWQAAKLSKPPSAESPSNVTSPTLQ